MKKLNERGDLAILTVALALLVVAVVLFLAIFSRWEVSEDNVSGVVYNTTNNSVVSGNTHFSVRASEDTFVSEENRSTYCLPPDSPYIDLVNRAAADKDIKVVVTSEKGFWLKMPWTCIDNITVTEQVDG